MGKASGPVCEAGGKAEVLWKRRLEPSCERMGVSHQAGVKKSLKRADCVSVHKKNFHETLDLLEH